MNDSGDAVPVDLSELRVITEGDAAMERELATAFIEQADITLDHLKDNQGEGHSKNWATAAHTLKGSSASMGARALCALCKAAQYAEDNPATRVALYAKIRDEYVRVKNYLAKTILGG